MSSWWSALNPFVEVRAEEEAHDEEDEKEEPEAGMLPNCLCRSGLVPY